MPPAAEQGPGHQPGGQPEAGAADRAGLLGQRSTAPSRGSRGTRRSWAGPRSNRAQPATTQPGRPDRDAAAPGLDHPTPADHASRHAAATGHGCGRSPGRRAGAGHGHEAARRAAPAAVRGIVTPADRQAAQVSPEQSNPPGPSAAPAVRLAPLAGRRPPPELAANPRPAGRQDARARRSPAGHRRPGRAALGRGGRPAPPAP